MMGWGRGEGRKGGQQELRSKAPAGRLELTPVETPGNSATFTPKHVPMLVFWAGLHPQRNAEVQTLRT